MRQMRDNEPRKTEKISRLPVRNRTNENGGKDLPAAMNPIHWQRFTTVEVLQTPHEFGPSEEMLQGRMTPNTHKQKKSNGINWQSNGYETGVECKCQLGSTPRQTRARL
jgi:hypothetical protein